jgi:hypothetical protein
MTRTALLTASAALLGLLLAPGDTVAQTRTIDTRGAWAAYGGLSDDGTPVCGLRALGNDRQLHLKYFRGETHLVVQAFRESWAVPDGVSVPVRMTIDGLFRLDAEATGRGTLVEWTIASHVLADFEPAFRAGFSMELVFPEGSETGWRANLRGSNATLRAFVSCMSMINSTAPTPSSQPHASTSTQPLRAPTQPTAPNVSQEAPKQIGLDRGLLSKP